MNVHQELHASAKCCVFSLRDSAANSRQASKSSRSKSAYSASRSSIVSPPARYSSMDSTGYRRPRMTGLPWQISGLMVILANNELIPRLCLRRPSYSSARFERLEHLLRVRTDLGLHVREAQRFERAARGCEVSSCQLD